MVVLLVGPFLVVNSNPIAAQAIVVIGGDHKPARMKKAVDLFKKGYAPIVVISAGTRVLEGGVWMAEAEVMKRQALALGLPEHVIMMETDSQSTFENAQYAKALSLDNGITSILLVTSAYHSRRANRIFVEQLEPEITVNIQPADLDYCPLCWPFYPDQAYVIGYEYYNWGKHWWNKAVYRRSVW